MHETKLGSGDERTTLWLTAAFFLLFTLRGRSPVGPRVGRLGEGRRALRPRVSDRPGAHRQPGGGPVRSRRRRRSRGRGGRRVVVVREAGVRSTVAAG